MGSINEVTILGNLGSDPELRFTQQGTAVCTLSIATSRTYKDEDGNKVETVEWHRVIVWGQSAEWAADNKRKGDQILVKGHLKTRSYEHVDKDTKAVSVRYATEVVARAWDPFGGVFALYGEKPRAGQKHPAPTDDDNPSFRNGAKRTGVPGTVGGPKTVGVPTDDEYVPYEPPADAGDNDIPF